MEPFDASVVRAAYDTVAQDYAEAFADDLLQLPLDREALDTFVQRIIAVRQSPLRRQRLGRR